MRASIVLSALLGAGAIAQPRLKHAALHGHKHRRDQIVDYMDGNEMVEEHIVDVYVTVPPGSAPAATPAPVIAEKLAVKAVSSSSAAPASVAINEKLDVHHQYHHVSLAAPEVQPSDTVVAAPPPSVTPVVSAIREDRLVVQESSTPVATSTASVESTPSTDTGSAPKTYWSDSPMSPITGGNGAVDVLTSANKWRNKWLADTPPPIDFKWSPMLANDSYQTAIGPIFSTVDEKTGEVTLHNEANATEMHHNNNPGSFGQCEASGNGNTQMNATAQSVTGIALTPFEEAWLMWMCERPLSTIQNICMQLGRNNQGNAAETGHADIIMSPSFATIGCYYMNATNPDGSPYVDPQGKSLLGNGYWWGYWTCDFGH